MRTSFPLASTLLATLLLAGCGGGGTAISSGDLGPRGADGLNALISVSAEAAGANCVNGGGRIEAGLDADRDGTLAAGEIGSTQYVCNATAGTAGGTGSAGPAGAPGSNGLNALVQMLDEPSGAHCATGGKAINVGIDGNANGVLDTGEVTSTGYVCNGTNGTNGTNGSNGTNGTNGTNGANGLNTLLSIAAEPAGANCTYGGSKVSEGLDSNANNVLDASEVGSTGYVCNGAPDPLLNWLNVAGTAIQALSNTGYIAGNDASSVVVTLPASPAIGDVVRISGAGLSGWRIAQNAGQAVYTKNLGGMAGTNWTAHQSFASTLQAVASSGDGNKLVAADRGIGPGGLIYVSTDSGANWASHGPSRLWTAVASSADGGKLVAAPQGGQIYTSADGGSTWTGHNPVLDWNAVASSADGSRLVAVAFNDQIYTSTDSGASWTPKGPSLQWISVASSADGSVLIAAARNSQLYTSTDGGVTWTPRENARNWQTVASSADGTKLVAAEFGGQIYTSTDAGTSWVARESSRPWRAVASSADGRKLMAAEFTAGRIYTSVDSGVTWTPRLSNSVWQSVALSADGSRSAAIGAITGNRTVYTSIAATTLGTPGSISGVQFDAIGLQYVGGGMFNVLDHAGNLIFE